MQKVKSSSVTHIILNLHLPVLRPTHIGAMKSCQIWVTTTQTGSPIYSKQLHISRGNWSKGEGFNATFLSCIGDWTRMCKCTQQDVIDTNACNSCNNPCDAHTYPFVNSLWTSSFRSWSLIHNLIQGGQLPGKVIT